MDTTLVQAADHHQNQNRQITIKTVPLYNIGDEVIIVLGSDEWMTKSSYDALRRVNPHMKEKPDNIIEEVQLPNGDVMYYYDWRPELINREDVVINSVLSKGRWLYTLMRYGAWFSEKQLAIKIK